MRQLTLHTRNTPRIHAAPRRAHTLLEVTIAVAIVAILSVSAIPALSSVQSARQAAGAQHVERLLLTARAQALATGRPFGVEVDWSNQRVRLVYIPSATIGPTAAPATGLSSADWTVLPSVYQGASITNIIYCGGASNSSGVLWFDSNANPSIRNSYGVRTGGATCDAEVTFAGGTVISVRQLTGAVERL